MRNRRKVLKGSVAPSLCRKPTALVPHILHRVHQRDLLPAFIAVSHMRVEELGLLVGEVVL